MKHLLQSMEVVILKKNNEYDFIDKFSFIYGFVYSVICTYSNGVKTEDITAVLREQGISKSLAERVISILKSEGHIFEPNKGELRALKDCNTFRIEEQY